MTKKILITAFLILCAISSHAKGLKTVSADKLSTQKAYIGGLFHVTGKYTSCTLHLTDMNNGDEYWISFYKKETAAFYEIPEGEYMVTFISGSHGNSYASMTPPEVMLPALRISKGSVFFLGEIRMNVVNGGGYPRMQLSYQLENPDIVKQLLDRDPNKVFNIRSLHGNYPAVEGSRLMRPLNQ